ncbi:MAG: RT0821/Lpp0805 family surface protein [Chromatiales bacterium]|jgi:hypothetical protein
MPNPVHSETRQPVIMGFRLSLISISVLGAILGATVVAAADTSPDQPSLYEPLPILLADARYDNRPPPGGSYQNRSRERHQPQQPPKQRTKGPGPGRERYQAPPREKSPGQYRTREHYPAPSKSHPKERERDRYDARHYDRDKPIRWHEHAGDRQYYKPRYNPPPRGTYHAGPPRHHPPHDIVIVRPFRYAYPRHHRYYHLYDGDVWGWLSFTAITLAIIDSLNEQQQREHELALYSAAAAPVGETIYWSNGNASGAITPIQDGTSSSGRYCREFQQDVNIGGERESLYGTACQNPDGSWEIVQ